MLNFFKKIFEVIWSIEFFLENETVQNFKGYQVILMFQLTLGIGLYSILGFIPKIYMIEFSISFMVIYAIAFLKYRFLKNSSLKKFFRTFTFKSYILSLVFMSTFLFFIFQFVIFLIFIAIGENVGPKTLKGFINTFYLIISIESILWFAFHIISNKASLQDIKIKIAQYSAIVATISIIAELITGKDLLKIPIALIALSYLWVTYLIELSARETRQ